MVAVTGGKASAKKRVDKTSVSTDTSTGVADANELTETTEKQPSGRKQIKCCGSFCSEKTTLGTVGKGTSKQISRTKCSLYVCEKAECRLAMNTHRENCL